MADIPRCPRIHLTAQWYAVRLWPKERTYPDTAPQTDLREAEGEAGTADSEEASEADRRTGEVTGKIILPCNKIALLVLRNFYLKQIVES